jgi:hypothetical protein
MSVLGGSIMKKVVCILLSVLLIFVMSVSIFAENEITEINDEQTPGAGLTVESLTYDEPDTIIIENEEIPEGTISPGVVEINEQEIPLRLLCPIQRYTCRSILCGGSADCCGGIDASG